jgi:glycosyltransferase involved in cell wall biosynthesis
VVEWLSKGEGLKILFVQDHLKNGGAARAAGRWAGLLRQRGKNVVQVAGDESPKGGHLLTGKPARGLGRVSEWFNGKGGRKSTVEAKLHSILQTVRPERIWFHNIAGGGKWGWSEEMVIIARQYAPVLWTLHDMWALGDSSESYWEIESVVEGGRLKGAKQSGLKVKMCEGEKAGSKEKSRVSRVCGEDRKYPVTVTAPSQWLANLTKELTGQECVFLPNPIDLKTFSPGDRATARRRWGLPEEGLVVLAGADSLADPRKGFDLLREAWGEAQRHGATLALFGRHGENRPGERYLGNLTSDEEMVAAYQAADLYVHPARMENAPCTIQESLACGTPVAAFAVGGIPEMVVPEKTGFLAGRVGAESLEKKLTHALADPARLQQIRRECRTAAEQVWDPDALAESF